MRKINKENTISKIKTDVKAQLVQEFLEFLTQKYGEDSVSLIRTGNSSKTNEIGFIIDEVENENGEVNSIVATINPTIKEFANRKTAKKVYEAFDFAAAKQEHENYISEKNANEKTKATNKEKKIVRDKKNREEATKKEETPTDSASF